MRMRRQRFQSYQNDYKKNAQFLYEETKQVTFQNKTSYKTTTRSSTNNTIYIQKYPGVLHNIFQYYNDYKF